MPTLPPIQPGRAATGVNSGQGTIIQMNCPKCQTPLRIQADFDKLQPLQAGMIRFPANDEISCPNCKQNLQVGPIRKNIEQQTGRKVARQ